MAKRNLLLKDFKLITVPGEEVTYPVEVPEGDSQNASENVTDFSGEPLPEGGSITTEQCRNYGGIPIAGFCTLSYTVDLGGGYVETYVSRYPVVD